MTSPAFPQDEWDAELRARVPHVDRGASGR